MRVIAGTAKGRKLFSVPGDSTRPIADRVKSALFSILESQGVVRNSHWLDLFGGTGAVGIEALSRGAAQVVFVERNPRAVQTIGKNLRATALELRAQVIRGDAFASLERPDFGPFDVIYIAPPQYRNLWIKALQAVDARPAMFTPHGQAIVQIHPKEDDPGLPLAHLRRYDERQYGSTRLVFYELTAAFPQATADADGTGVADYAETSEPRSGAATFQQQNISPSAIELAEAFAHAHYSEPARFVEGEAGLILGEYACLQRPNAHAFRGLHQGLQQGFADAPAPERRRDVHADLCYSTVSASVRD